MQMFNKIIRSRIYNVHKDSPFIEHWGITKGIQIKHELLLVLQCVNICTLMTCALCDKLSDKCKAQVIEDSLV